MTADIHPNIPGRPDLTAAAIKPEDIHFDRKEGLRILWADGHQTHFTLKFLRDSCPCAGCQKEDSEPKKPKPSGTGGLSLSVLPNNYDRRVEFKDAKLVGNYALRIVWGDGHDTGIYEYRYLREIDPT